MTSAVEICNQALSHVQAEGSIEDFDVTKGEEERQCAKFYDTLRRQSLAGYEWAFATEFVQLAPVTSTVRHAYYPYLYQYPARCLRFLYTHAPFDTETTGAIVHPDNQLNRGPKLKHTVYRDPTFGRLIACQIPEAVGEYVRDIEDPTEFDDTFSLALGWWIGAHIAIPLTGKEDRKQACLQMFNSLAPAARVKDAQEDDDSREQDASWITARQ